MPHVTMMSCHVKLSDWEFNIRVEYLSLSIDGLSTDKISTYSLVFEPIGFFL